MSGQINKNFDLQKITTFIVKKMLNNDKLDINKIKSEFSLDDFQVREVIIRLYNDNKVFGKIKHYPDGRTYLQFSMDEIQKKNLTLEDILDWDLEQFEVLGITQKETPRVENLKSLMAEMAEKKTQPMEIVTSKHREIDQKDLITVELNVKIIGIRTVILIGIQNNSDFPATEGKLRLKYDEGLTIRPQFNEYSYEDNSGEIIIGINDLPAKSAKTLRLYVSDIHDRKFSIRGFFQFRNNNLTMRLIRMEEINVDFNIPEITPLKGDINLIKSIMRNPEFFKRMQGVGCPDLKCEHDIMKIFEEILEIYHFMSIIKNDNPAPMWFYLGSITKDNESLQILAIPQIKNGFFALYVASKNKDLVSTLIHNLVIDFQKHLINRKFLPETYKLVDLNCVSCQNILNSFPPQGAEIECPKCGYRQKMW
ncbi:MAG: hypothetical protein DRO88_04255 [Promethearchaeia archaeon]|nr:MAG: hypothetical protein DRO88_04255 [Candidatus Lokiarchaeia archaeon]